MHASTFTTFFSFDSCFFHFFPAIATISNNFFIPTAVKKTSEKTTNKYISERRDRGRRTRSPQMKKARPSVSHTSSPIRQSVFFLSLVVFFFASLFTFLKDVRLSPVVRYSHPRLLFFFCRHRKRSVPTAQFKGAASLVLPQFLFFSIPVIFFYSLVFFFYFAPARSLPRSLAFTISLSLSFPRDSSFVALPAVLVIRVP